MFICVPVQIEKDFQQRNNANRLKKPETAKKSEKTFCAFSIVLSADVNFDAGHYLTVDVLDVDVLK